MNIAKEREEIIEMFGMHFEKLYNIPPLAGRILGILIVDGCKCGLTFEELVEKLGASKSSISTNLNLLLKMDKAYYSTICGDRKKYFKPSDLSNRLANYLKIIDSELQILNRIINYREETISCAEEKTNLDNAKAFKTHIIELEKLVSNTITQFKDIENNNKNQK